MKTILYRLSGQPMLDDLIIVSYSSPRGGRTHVWYRASADDSCENVATILAVQIDRGWMKEAFESKAKGSTIVIQCTGLVSDVIFDYEIEGSDGLKVEIEEL